MKTPGGAVAHDAHHVVLPVELLHPGAAHVDHGDAVSFLTQLLEKLASHPAAAGYHDVHRITSGYETDTGMETALRKRSFCRSSREISTSASPAFRAVTVRVQTVQASSCQEPQAQDTQSSP